MDERGWVRTSDLSRVRRGAAETERLSVGESLFGRGVARA
jgi:hypothetical protein